MMHAIVLLLATVNNMMVVVTGNAMAAAVATSMATMTVTVIVVATVVSQARVTASKMHVNASLTRLFAIAVWPFLHSPPKSCAKENGSTRVCVYQRQRLPWINTSPASVGVNIGRPVWTAHIQMCVPTVLNGRPFFKQTCS